MPRRKPCTTARASSLQVWFCFAVVEVDSKLASHFELQSSCLAIKAALRTKSGFYIWSEFAAALLLHLVGHMQLLERLINGFQRFVLVTLEIVLRVLSQNLLRCFEVVDCLDDCWMVVSTAFRSPAS